MAAKDAYKAKLEEFKAAKEAAGQKAERKVAVRRRAGPGRHATCALRVRVRSRLRHVVQSTAGRRRRGPEVSGMKYEDRPRACTASYIISNKGASFCCICDARIEIVVHELRVSEV